MFKPLIPALLIIAALSSCSSMKPLSSGKNQVATPVATTTSHKSNDIKFLDDISVTAPRDKDDNVSLKKENTISNKDYSTTASTERVYSEKRMVGKASALEIKYAALLNTDVELLADNQLLPYIDEWYGTRYKMGGTSKSGIDCSAFVQAIYLSAFAVNLPRTARDQFRNSRIISATELKEGDLVFFNTRGGISHVGIYLQNNKFVHASSTNGVKISDLFEPYYLKRYMGAGRIEKPGAKAGF
jgi:cell wall-associated NlpC family hydrolase